MVTIDPLMLCNRCFANHQHTVSARTPIVYGCSLSLLNADFCALNPGLRLSSLLLVPFVSGLVGALVSSGAMLSRREVRIAVVLSIATCQVRQHTTCCAVGDFVAVARR